MHESTTTPEAAKVYEQLGWSPVPVPAGQKGPTLEAWNDPARQFAPEEFRDGQNIGLRLGSISGNLTDVDLDAFEARAAAAVFLPATPMMSGHAGKPRSHWWYITAEPLTTVQLRDPLLERTKAQAADPQAQGATLLEIRANDKKNGWPLQTVVPPSIHPSGESITWVDGLAPARVSGEELVRAVRFVGVTALIGRYWPSGGEHGHEFILALSGALLRKGLDLDTVKMIVLNAAAIVGYSRAKEADIDDTARNLAEGRHVTGWPTLNEFLDKRVVRRAEEWIGKADTDTTPKPAKNVSARGTQQESESFPDLITGYQPEDVGNAERLVAVHGGDLRYCHAFRKWLLWDGTRWALDEGQRTLELTTAVMLQFGLQAVKANNEALTKFAAGCRRSARLINAMHLAQPTLRITPAELDTHTDLMNCRNGVVDLRTGKLLPHARELFITKLVHHDYQPEAKCPVFMRFLSQITANHPGLINYLQKAFGYSLTARTIEKAVFLLHGGGDNGKSTLLSTFCELVSEYAVVLQVESLMTQNRESANSQADLADLFGARFVMTSETEEGQRLSEAKIKRITQGMGRIRAVRKYENPFTFEETHKLWVDANHLPIIRGTDDAIWNRLHAIPFDVVIPKRDQDGQLGTKLAAEAEGILAWAVAGAVRWFRERLGKPPDVEQVSAAWRKDSDQISRFIEDCCVIGPSLQVPARALYLAYKHWAEEASERVETEKTFAERMAYQGFSKEKEPTGIVYVEIGLSADQG